MRSALPFSTGGRSLSSSHRKASILSTPPAIFYVQMSPCFRISAMSAPAPAEKSPSDRPFRAAAPFGRISLPSMVESYPNVMLSFVDGKSTDFERMILLGSMDLGLSNSPPNNNRVGSFLLNEERYYLIANRAKALLHKRWTSSALTRAPPRFPFRSRSPRMSVLFFLTRSETPASLLTIWCVRSAFLRASQ